MRCVNCMKEFDEKYGLCPHCGHIIGTPAKEPFQLPPGTILSGRYLVGTAVGLLFAPEKGEDTRTKIAEILRKKGIHLSKADMENLIDEIADVKDEVAE